MFVDVQYQISLLKSTTKADRANELCNNVPGCNIVMVGGFPIIEDNDGEFLWCGSRVSKEIIRAEIANGLGASGMLTHMNPNNKSLEGLGSICKKYNHTWAYNWMTLSILFCGYGLEADLAYSRDSRFFMSWTEGVVGLAFMATASLKDWLRFSSKRHSPDFPASVRHAMSDSGKLLGQICP